MATRVCGVDLGLDSCGLAVVDVYDGNFRVVGMLHLSKNDDWSQTLQQHSSFVRLLQNAKEVRVEAQFLNQHGQHNMQRVQQEFQNALVARGVDRCRIAVRGAANKFFVAWKLMQLPIQQMASIVTASSSSPSARYDKYKLLLRAATERLVSSELCVSSDAQVQCFMSHAARQRSDLADALLLALWRPSGDRRWLPPLQHAVDRVQLVQSVTNRTLSAEEKAAIQSASMSNRGPSPPQPQPPQTPPQPLQPQPPQTPPQLKALVTQVAAAAAEAAVAAIMRGSRAADAAPVKRRRLAEPIDLTAEEDDDGCIDLT